MGLVGIVLGCVATQRSVDYLPTREFAMRPRLWLTLISRNRCTVSFSPPFGYTLCARRLRPGDAEALDLSAWRVAGVGAEMIHPESLERFAELLAPAGFKASSFLPCYGMAECSLAVSFAPLERGACSDWIDIETLSHEGVAHPVAARDAGKAKAFINCGVPLPGYEVEIRDEAGRALPERHCGRIFLRGPSLMSGYFANAEASREVLSADGWLDTGDLGYAVDGALHLTGRAKDLMIIKGRNIWPQDLEHLAEQQPEVRPTDSSAFSITDADDEEMAVLVVQTRETDPSKLALLADRLQEKIHAEFGIQCLIELVAAAHPAAHLVGQALAQLGAQGVRRAPPPGRRRVPDLLHHRRDALSSRGARGCARARPDGRQLRPRFGWRTLPARSSRSCARPSPRSAPAPQDFIPTPTSPPRPASTRSR